MSDCQEEDTRSPLWVTHVSLMAANEASVRVRFVAGSGSSTKLAGELPSTPFDLPADMNRLGLSEVVNHVLGTASAPTPFDFVCDGRLLRTSLRKHLAQSGQSLEDIIEVSVVLAIPAPRSAGQSAAPDWLGTVAAGERLVIGGAMDGALTAYLVRPAGSDGPMLDERPTRAWLGHAGAVRASDLMEAGGLPHTVVATGGKDSIARLWRLRQVPSSSPIAASSSSGSSSLRAPAGSDSGRLEVECAAILSGHEASVSAVSIAPGVQRAASGDWDGSLCVWDARVAVLTAEEARGVAGEAGGPGGSLRAGAAAGDSTRASKKRLRATPSDEPSDELSSDASSVSVLEPSSRLVHAHQGPVSGLAWVGDGTLVTSSWDHSVRVWDLARGVATLRLSAGKVCTGLAVSGGGLTAATSHPDHAVRVWDLRDGADDAPLRGLALRGHAAWVSAVAWRPGHAHHVASASHDGRVLLWDTRSPSGPLHTVHTHTGQALAVAWAGAAAVVSGGEDRAVRASVLPTSW